MDHIARECDYVTGRTVAHGGAGDSSVLTAYGVFQGMRAAAEVAWGTDNLAGRTVGVAGVGKVGHHLVRHLIEDGASVVVTDVAAAAVERVREEFPQVTVVASADELVASALDVYAPCALGGALTDEVVEVLSARIVCGAANNQLAHPGVEKVLAERGVLYAPDYCVNSGGLIQVADELEGFSFERAQQRATGIFETTRTVFELAASDGVPPAIAADRLAERRMRDVGRLRGIWLPGSVTRAVANPRLTRSTGDSCVYDRVSRDEVRCSPTTRRTRRGESSLVGVVASSRRAAHWPTHRSPSRACGTSGRGRPWSAWLLLGRVP